MTNHKDEAERWAEKAMAGTDPIEAIAFTNYAQVHATLALVDQTRIANLIAWQSTLVEGALKTGSVPEMGGQQGVMRSTPSNPYLTEKEQSSHER